MLAQTGVDYTALHACHEVMLRVELLRARLDVLKVDRSSSVAEFGLGSGDVTKLLAQRFNDLTCVDCEQKRLEEVDSFISPSAAWFIKADAATWRSKKHFDHIFALGLLEHCADPVAVLRNLAAMLTESGRVHILVNNAHSIHRLLGVVIGDIKSVTELSAADVKFGHYRVYTPSQLEAHVAAAGLHKIYNDQHYLKPLPSHLMDTLPIELSRGFVELGRRLPEFAAYSYIEAVRCDSLGTPGTR